MNKTFISCMMLFLGNAVFGQNSPDLSLSGEWKLSYGRHDRNAPANPDDVRSRHWPVIKAVVPGNVEIDLLAAGKIRDPQIGNNIYELRKFEAYQWWYHRSFSAPPVGAGDRVDIVFDGLDCFGSIWVNDRLVGRADNMFIEHRFDITDVLVRGGSNSIYVRIEPAVSEGMKYPIAVVGSRYDFGPEGVHVRKAPHMYGWDIMPRLVSAGLWRDVRLEIRKPTRLNDIYWMTNNVDIPGRKAQLLLDWEISTDRPTIDGLSMEISLSRGSGTLYRQSVPLIVYAGRQVISVDNVEFWWPRGYGDPALYDAVVRIVDEKKTVLDERKQRIGIRTAELIRTDITTEENPGEFVFMINGEKIFVRGTNWVPLDALHSRDRYHLRDVFSMITDLNCNMIRCWGGNVYEDHAFFDLCDENGVMVWQDFAMGCTTYPQDDEFIRSIRREAISVVLKLRRHPSLVLWSGNNENDASLEWTFSKPVDPALDRNSREILPRVIWEFDPVRSYLPSSPYSSDEYFMRGRDPDLLPEVHLWGPRGYYKAPFYTNVRAHFVSEIGYHGCPNRSSLERMFDRESVYPWTADGKWNDEWQTKGVRAHPLSHTMDSRNDLMTKQVKIVFGGVPGDLDEFIFASQAVQAEAVKYFIEFWRMDKFRKTGIIWWNLRDGWPILSDAVVDYYNSKKLAYYYIRQVQHNVCVVVGDAKDGRHPVVAVNDTREEHAGTVTIRDADTREELFRASYAVVPNGKVLIGAVPERAKQAMWLIDYSVGNERFSNHYLNGTVPFRLEDYHRWYRALNISRE